MANTHGTQGQLPELLAPAGDRQSLLAAVDAGADAVYLGLRSFNARATARNFSIDDLTVLIPYAESRGVRVYVAVNSLVREDELAAAVQLLHALAELRPHGLIVQDAGVARICRQFFPQLPLHASTLMAIHNLDGIRQMAAMGFSRVVLARELTLEELADLVPHSPLGVEVFVHGALCFSFSGLCLASSYIGGRSGLRGRCAQPCRRIYQAGRHRGHFLSPNDLSAIDLVPRLVELGIKALKIEGRMKPAGHVALVVKAYRQALDSGGDRQALKQARHFLEQALGRKPTSGHLIADKISQVITPHRTGTSGKLVGRISRLQGEQMIVHLRGQVQVGDRLRLDSDRPLAGKPFTIREMYHHGKKVSMAEPGSRIALGRVQGARVNDRVFKTDSKTLAPGTSTTWGQLRHAVERLPLPTGDPQVAAKLLKRNRVASNCSLHPGALCIRIDQADLIGSAFDAGADAVIVNGDLPSLHRLLRLRLHHRRKERLYLSLPAVILPPDWDRYRKLASMLPRAGYRRWVVANWSHLPLLAEAAVAELVADCTFNVINSQAALALHELGCTGVILSWEVDQPTVQRLLARAADLNLFINVYGFPPLAVSRLQVPVAAEANIGAPDGERWLLEHRGRLTVVRPERPVCLFAHSRDLVDRGCRGLVVDLSGKPLRPGDMRQLLQAYRRNRQVPMSTTFNFERRLQ